MVSKTGLGIRFTKAQAAQINAGMREARRKVEQEFLRDGPCVRVPAKAVCALIERSEHGWDAVPPSADGDPGMPAGSCCKLCEASAEGNGALVPHRDDCPVLALRAALGGPAPSMSAAQARAVLREYPDADLSSFRVDGDVETMAAEETDRSVAMLLSRAERRG